MKDPASYRTHDKGRPFSFLFRRCPSKEEHAPGRPRFVKRDVSTGYRGRDTISQTVDTLGCNYLSSCSCRKLDVQTHPPRGVSHRNHHRPPSGCTLMRDLRENNDRYFLLYISYVLSFRQVIVLSFYRFFPTRLTCEISTHIFAEM